MKSVYSLLIATIVVSCLLLAAVLAPTGSDATTRDDDFNAAPPEVSAAEEDSSAKTPSVDTRPLIVEAPRPAPAGMVWVPGGRFRMGIDSFPEPGEENPNRIKPDEYPAHDVELDGFWMDETPVTNRQFQEFVEATGYVTFAEKVPTREDFAKSGADVSLIPDEALKAGSMCFNSKFDPDSLITGVPNWEYQVWMVVDGANWKQPGGPDTNLEGLMDHPVVHVTWDDAVAYCEWVGKRLPTEAEFEYAARSGGKDLLYPWGDELVPDGKYMANFWQGEFPTNRLNEDGFLTTSPVKTYPPNELGLYDMAGNVWEWCHDYFHIDYYSNSPLRNPKGPKFSVDPQEPGIVKRVQRGGSFLCNINSCTGYRTGARMRGEITSSSFHNGFRCVVDTTMLKEFEAANAKNATDAGTE
ncbi:Serine/threonine-protein kinase pkn1 [Thalassoglobus neptunius]|uniref:Serine/threonine-protein kinase pkn1 n=1 Tax=Thalassoglobus neptunius TaxID=1938619 RepID=A0A5C5X3F7_9PLAN|nr:formylglycine-generating enzyme family protein [Thalassoglobus neptunius]TWT57328.1 Serine/threonine-protein kinase pkn1 [Thalassoglobus neptunius]